MFLLREKERSWCTSVCDFCPNVHGLDHVQRDLSNDPFAVIPNSVTFASFLEVDGINFSVFSTMGPFWLQMVCWIVVGFVTQSVWHLGSDLNHGQSEIEFFLLNFPFLIFLQVLIEFMSRFYQVSYRVLHCMYVSCTSTRRQMNHHMRKGSFKFCAIMKCQIHTLKIMSYFSSLMLSA